MTPFAITYLVDIIFAKVVCISIPGGLPELPEAPKIRTIDSHYKLGARQLSGSPHKKSHAKYGLKWLTTR